MPPVQIPDDVTVTVYVKVPVTIGVPLILSWPAEDVQVTPEGRPVTEAGTTAGARV